MTTMFATTVFDGGQAALKTEEAAHATWQYAPGAVPGLLQTPDYATAVADALPHLNEGREDHFRLRMERGQQMRALTHLRHRFLLSGAVHDHAPRTALMDAQRAHLADLDQLDHIEIRVRPSGDALTDPTGFTLRGGRAWIECGDLYFAGPGDVQTWIAEWERLWSCAVPLATYQPGS
ncbi:Scr1 family TA system antitoxin-like transcriptional regulator [Nocardiopsis dassonvillei]|uniref:Scr1 family TA system antitoxin-like transcriptional regulator n=1 Tax=Nocardiopsis dassonvillei TaxID=2014 RepID=UPI0033FAB90F